MGSPQSWIRVGRWGGIWGCEAVLLGGGRGGLVAVGGEWAGLFKGQIVKVKKRLKKLTTQRGQGGGG